jgi:hypothetical protein
MFQFNPIKVASIATAKDVPPTPRLPIDYSAGTLASAESSASDLLSVDSPLTRRFSTSQTRCGARPATLSNVCAIFLATAASETSRSTHLRPLSA